MSDRPTWCQDSTCEPVSNTVSPNDTEATSAFCCGRLAEPVEFTRHGFTHSNDAHFCFRSSVRGVTMLEINEMDADLIARDALRLNASRGRRFNLRWLFGPRWEELTGVADAARGEVGP